MQRSLVRIHSFAAPLDGQRRGSRFRRVLWSFLPTLRTTNAIPNFLLRVCGTVAPTPLVRLAIRRRSVVRLLQKGDGRYSSAAPPLTIRSTASRHPAGTPGSARRLCVRHFGGDARIQGSRMDAAYPKLSYGANHLKRENERPVTGCEIFRFPCFRLVADFSLVILPSGFAFFTADSHRSLPKFVACYIDSLP
jgi:hypothetical protein